MTHKASTWLFLAATLLFCAATFQIAEGHWFPGVIFFALATAFMSLARIRSKSEAFEGDR